MFIADESASLIPNPNPVIEFGETLAAHVLVVAVYE
jgi:hypothetical protein